MSHRMTAAHVFGLFAVGAAFAPAARATEPSVVSTGIATPESRFERAFRLRGSPSVASVWTNDPEAPVEGLDFAPERSLVMPGLVDAPERRALAEEFIPTIAIEHDSSQHPAIPNHPALSDTFFLGLGAFAASSNTEARLDSPSGVGTSIDMEDLMGLDSNDVVFQGLARWRFTQRWRLELEHFELNRSNSKAITGQIEWGDQTFPVNTVVDTEFNIAVTRLSVGYSFFQRQDKELGIALGFHVTDLQAGMSAGGGNADEGEVLAPLPVISMYGQFALTDVWALSSRIDAFRLEYDPYEGHVFSLGIDMLCQPWRHFGFGFGWRSLEIEASVDDGDWRGEISTNYQGPIVFAAVSF